ncbi:MAG: TetR/AcrR family transcriptional regulator [Acidobacteria bacterium]|nr:TetR/AcrR family transcriptional regulator [Acidobacteriota bacterium]
MPRNKTLRQQRTPSFDAKLLTLLSVAARVFAAEGYDKTSMRRIAAEAGMSLAGIYHYCASKQELLYDIQFHAFDSLLRGLRECAENVADPRERLRAAVGSHVRHFGDNMDALKVCARELQALEGKAYRDVHGLRRAYFDAMHDIVKQLRPRTRSRRHSWLATANLFGMINWFYQWYDAGQASAGLDQLADHQVALFLDGYAAPTRRAKRGHA